MNFAEERIKKLKDIMQSTRISEIVITHSPGEWEEWTIEDIVCYKNGQKVPTPKDIDRISYLLFEAFENEDVHDESGKKLVPSKDDTTYLLVFFDEEGRLCLKEMSSEVEYAPETPKKTDDNTFER